MRRRLALRIGLALLLGLPAAWAGRTIYKRYHWKNFAAVVPDHIYRSGQMSVDQLDAAIARLRLRHVVCFNAEHAEAERELCRRRKVSFHYIPMPEDGRGEPKQFADVLDLLGDPDRQPILLHCQAGVARTGAAVALYRMKAERWPLENAVAELASFERLGNCDPPLRRHLADLATKLVPESSTHR